MMREGRSDPLQRLGSALLAATITPGLRSVLLFDAGRPVLDAVASTLERMLLLSTGRVVVRRYLGAAQHEDDLWLRPDLSSKDGRLAVMLRPGALAADADGACLALVVIPDLSELSLAAARGCVALIGADVAHLERHGASHQWLPNACWLAACDRAAIGKVSPHLLDRFAVRLDAAWSLSSEERVEDIQRWALGQPSLEPRRSEWEAQRLHEAAAARPKILPQMVDQVLDLLPCRQGASPRREITLARLAVACARLEGIGTAVGRKHVDWAASLLDLPPPPVTTTTTTTTTGPPAGEAETVPDMPGLLDPAVAPATSGLIAEDAPAVTAPVEEAVLDADPAEPLVQVQLPDPEELTGPYPEDQATRERDMAALREGPVRSRSTTVPRGSVVGVQQARTAQDLALLNTILAAAVWQPYRRMHALDAVHGSRLQLLPSDLRSYRRAPSPEQLLVLVIDYTCLEGWDWTAPLLPYLRWAYVERAGIVLVRVGAKDSSAATRADRLATRNLLDPRLDLALAADPGRATPLAHGLFLALQALRHGLQHGEGSVRRARLVVVTDGRGNVPLQLDSDLSVARAVGRAGVEDTLEVASSIRMLAAVETFLVDPKPDLHPELVLELARALGAELVQGRHKAAEEEAGGT